MLQHRPRHDGANGSRAARDDGVAGDAEAAGGGVAGRGVERVNASVEGGVAAWGEGHFGEDAAGEVVAVIGVAAGHDGLFFLILLFIDYEGIYMCREVRDGLSC